MVWPGLEAGAEEESIPGRAVAGLLRVRGSANADSIGRVVLPYKKIPREDQTEPESSPDSRTLAASNNRAISANTPHPRYSRVYAA